MSIKFLVIMRFCFIKYVKECNMVKQFVCAYKPNCQNFNGKLLLCSDGESLTQLDFIDSLDLHLKLDSSIDLQDLPIFTQTKKWLDLYFSGEIPQFTPKFIFSSDSSHFSLRVWEILQEIPYGKLITYGEIAKRIAQEFGISKMSAQAVGGAVGRNPIAIIIPCHRVIGANYNLTGYSGGISNKLALLRIEGITTNLFKMPKKCYG